MSTDSALVIVNLGTPLSPAVRDVRKFLRRFLSDRRVVNLPRVLWWPILYGIILPLRAPRVAKLYAKIWWPEGSPLRVITDRQVRKLERALAAVFPRTAVCSAMVCGDPSLAGVVDNLAARGVKEVVILPLYPQFCSATTGSVCDQLQHLRNGNSRVQLSMVKSYHDDPGYISALAASISDYWQQHGRGDKLLFSFHGIPQSLVDSGDPYYRQCHETAARVSELLSLPTDAWQVCFQSRFGKAEWVKPYTDAVIRESAERGIARLDVITPAFASDCLETLEEIAVQNAAMFVAHGGKELRLIPCLNDSDAHISMMLALYRQHLQNRVVVT